MEPPLREMLPSIWKGKKKLQIHNYTYNPVSYFYQITWRHIQGHDYSRNKKRHTGRRNGRKGEEK
jgi:hypothetical protein